MKFMNPPEMTEQWVGRFGWPAELAVTIGIVELTCLVIYLFPRTAVLARSC